MTNEQNFKIYMNNDNTLQYIISMQKSLSNEYFTYAALKCKNAILKKERSTFV